MLNRVRVANDYDFIWYFFSNPLLTRFLHRTFVGIAIVSITFSTVSPHTSFTYIKNYSRNGFNWVADGLYNNVFKVIDFFRRVIKIGVFENWTRFRAFHSLTRSVLGICIFWPRNMNYSIMYYTYRVKSIKISMCFYFSVIESIPMFNISIIINITHGYCGLSAVCSPCYRIYE